MGYQSVLQVAELARKYGVLDCRIAGDLSRVLYSDPENQPGDLDRVTREVVRKALFRMSSRLKRYQL